MVVKIMKKTIFSLALLLTLTGCGNTPAVAAPTTDTTAIVPVDDDVIEQQLVTDLKSLAITTPIETNAQLDSYLQQIANEISGQTLSAAYKESLLDVTEDAVSNYFDITPVPDVGLADDGYEDYFERNQLSNQDSSDYIEITLASLLK